MHVTVTIPTKNERDTISETLRMLDAQTRPPDTVLVADESDDDTAALARATAAPHGYDIEIFTPERSGVGAAREAMRRRAPDGLLVCLDAQVRIDEDWLAEHIAIHDATEGEIVCSGPWPGQDIGGETRVFTPGEAAHPAFFVEANCSMQTETAARIGGWDATFQRGCDWDFRYRLARTDGVVAVATERVGAAPMATNSSPRLHITKKLNRPSSVPFLRKYGTAYLRFHPTHLIGDLLGILALAFAATALVSPAAAVLGVGGLMAAYAVQFNPPGFSRTERVLAAPAVFSLGISTLRAVVGR